MCHQNPLISGKQPKRGAEETLLKKANGQALKASMQSSCQYHTLYM